MTLTLLALETSSSRCGVALLRAAGGDVDILSLEHEGTQEHAERLLPMARDLLNQAGLTPGDLDAVAFGQGPGGFTGLRVACGVAQGIALAEDIPVIPVVSHLAVAARVPARPDQVVVTALDARMSEVYLAVYRRLDGASDDTDWQVLQPPVLIAAAEVIPWVEGHIGQWRSLTGLALAPLLAGDAWTVYATLMTPRADWPRYDAARPDVRDVARLARQAWLRGESLPAELAAPLYVRDKVAYTTAERQRGEGGNPKAAPSLPLAATAPPDEIAAEPAPAEPVQASSATGGPAPDGQAAGGGARNAAAGITLAAMCEADLAEMEQVEASVQAFPWSRRNFADALQAGYDSCVIRRDGRLLGFCILMYAPDVAHVLVIAVAKDLHRQGLGSILIEWCAARTRAHAIAGLLLEVRISNLSAQAFYERHGFLRVGLRRGYYPAGKGKREDAVVMQKVITLDEAPRG